MREIKFRAWDKKNKRMFIPISFQHGVHGIYNIIKEKLTSVGSSLYGGDFVLMQYTGLKDKNGKEIYEEDIVGYPVSIYLGEDANGIAHWGDEEIHSTDIIFTNGGFTGRQDTCSLIDTKINKIEVIGNIYENPELLETN
jgi:uncharacterized phage protein (TIGR01671 family)